MTTFSFDANSKFAVLNITPDVKHDITVKGKTPATVTTVNNAASAAVTFDPFKIITMNQLSAQEFVLNEMEIITLNIRAAATIRLENHDSTITTMNIQKDVKLAKYVVDEKVKLPETTVKKDVTYKTDGTVDKEGTQTTNKSEYITDGKISVTDATLTGYSDVTTGAAATLKFKEAEKGCPKSFDISNYSKVTVNFKLYDAEDNVITEGFDTKCGAAKLCLNDSSAGEDIYNFGYGDGLIKPTFYFNSLTKVDDKGIASKTFELSDATSKADCITSQLDEKADLSKVEIISIVLTAKK